LPCNGRHIAQTFSHCPFDAILTFYIKAILTSSVPTHNPGGGIQFLPEDIPLPGLKQQSDENERSFSAKMPKHRKRYAKLPEFKLNIHAQIRRNT
jgi:hypothetical protein